PPEPPEPPEPPPEPPEPIGPSEPHAERSTKDKSVASLVRVMAPRIASTRPYLTDGKHYDHPVARNDTVWFSHTAHCTVDVRLAGRRTARTGGAAAHEPEETPTVAESPVARAAEASGAATHAGKSHTSTVHSATAMRAMRAEELTRARGFGLVVSIVALVALASQQFVTTAVWLQRLMSGSLVLTGAVAFYAFLTVKRTKHPTALQRVFGAVSVATAIIAQYYAGVFSPAPAVIGLGIAYWGLSDDRRFALGLVTVTLTSYFIMTAGVSLKALPDLGLFPARDATLPQ